MDSHKANDLKARLSTIPRIARRDRWVAAEPSRPLNLGIAASWFGFLYTLGLFSASSNDAAAEPLSFADNLALLFFLVILGGILAVVGMAMANHPGTPAVSAVAGIAIIVLGATCGFAGHPVSAWGPDAALAAIIVGGSVAVMARRAPSND